MKSDLILLEIFENKENSWHEQLRFLHLSWPARQEIELKAQEVSLIKINALPNK